MSIFSEEKKINRERIIVREEGFADTILPVQKGIDAIRLFCLDNKIKIFYRTRYEEDGLAIFELEK